MHAAIAVPGNSNTFLTHMLARGLEDDRYVVERFQALADGNIRRLPGDEPATKGRRKAKRTTVSLKDVQALRPARTEIIICTGLRIRSAGAHHANMKEMRFSAATENGASPSPSTPRATLSFWLRATSRAAARVSFLRGPPPKVVWAKLGNCTTDDVERGLRESQPDLLELDNDEDAAFAVVAGGTR